MLNLKYSGLYIGIILIFSIWATHLIGGFHFFHGLVYDFIVFVTPSKLETSDKVLLIKADYLKKNAGDEVWLNLLENIEKHKPEQIIFSFMPVNASKAFYSYAQKNKNVFFGRLLNMVEGDHLPEPLPKGAKGVDLNVGVIAIPDDEYGIHRLHKPFYEIKGKTYPSVIFIATSDRLKVKPSVNTAFPVDFLHYHGHFPEISLKRALSDKLLPDLFKNRSVIIGFSHFDDVPGLKTPAFFLR